MLKIAHDSVEVCESFCVLVGSSCPETIVDDSTSSRDEVSSVVERGCAVEAAIDELVQRCEPVFSVFSDGISLDIFGPVEDCSKPFSFIILANTFGVLAQVDVAQLGYSREHLLVEVSVVVGASSLNCTASPPATSLSR